MNSVLKDQILGLVRHLLTFVGGIAIAKGLVSASVETDIIGGLMTLIGAVWSIIDKTGNTPDPVPTSTPIIPTVTPASTSVPTVTPTIK